MRALAPDDDGEVSPGDAVLDVESSKLARDRRVLLRGVRRAPRIDAHRLPARGAAWSARRAWRPANDLA